MSIHFDNYLKIILYQSRLCTSSKKIDSYTLNFFFISSSLETEPIIIPDITFGEKCFYFEIPNTLQSNAIEISARSKSMYLIKKTICKILIPFSVAKCSHQRQWYFLKSEDNENILKVLISFCYEFSLNKISKHAHNYSDLSYDLILPKSSSRYSNGGDSLCSHHKISSQMNLTFTRSNSIEILQSSSTSCINHHNSKMPVLYEIKNEYKEEEFQGKNSKIIVTMINNKINSINASQQDLEKKLGLIEQREKALKRSKMMMMKEKKKLDAGIKVHDRDVYKYDKSSLSFMTKYSHYQNELDKTIIQRDIDDYDKATFINMTFIHNSTNFLMPKERDREKRDISSGSSKKRTININSTTTKKDKHQKKFIKEHNKRSQKHLLKADSSSSSHIKEAKANRLNSIYFSSNSAEMYYSMVYNNNDPSKTLISNSSSSLKHLSSKINIKHTKRQPKDNKMLDSIDKVHHKPKSPSKDLDNIKVIKIRARKCTPAKSKQKNGVYLRASLHQIKNAFCTTTTTMSSSHTNITFRQHNSLVKSIEKGKTVMSLKESSSAQHFNVLNLNNSNNNKTKKIRDNHNHH